MLSNLLPLNRQTQRVSWNMPIAAMILRKEGCCLQTWLNLWPRLYTTMPGTPSREQGLGSTQDKKWEPEAGMETCCSTHCERRASICLQDGDEVGGWHCWGISGTGAGKSGARARGWGQSWQKPSGALTYCFSDLMLPFCPWHLWLQSANTLGSTFSVNP